VLPLENTIVAMEKATPLILAAGADARGPIGLPSGPFEPLAHRTFEIALRNFVAEQTALAVGYVEQLYTFGDRGRHARAEDADPHVLSVGYLALTRLPDEDAALIAVGVGRDQQCRDRQGAARCAKHPRSGVLT